MEKFKGIIVEESLIDNRVLNNFDIETVRISIEEEASERWHLYTVNITINEIEELKNYIKSGWYMHFWKNRDIIAIFKDRVFSFNYDNKETWESVIKYGISVGISREQLDFPID